MWIHRGRYKSGNSKIIKTGRMLFNLSIHFSKKYLNISFFKFIFQTCFYSKTKGASVGCWKNACRRSFHFPCGIKNNCISKFTADIRFYCHQYFESNTTVQHDNNEICELCKKNNGNI